MVGTCHLCGLHANLCDSHVIPDFMYELAYHEGTFVSLSSHPRHPARHIQTGFYEKLLCIDCERRFSRYERTTATLLRGILATPLPSAELKVLEGDSRFQSFDYNYPDLKLFALSVIWRCHVSTRHPFARINLGKHAEKIRTMLLTDDPGSPKHYAVLLMRIAGSSVAAQTLVPPVAVRLDVRGLPSVRGYRMRAMGFDWFFVVSSHTPHQFNQQPFVGGGTQLMVAVEHLHEVTEMLKLRDMAIKWGKL